MTWILYALLATGEAGPVPVPRDVCERTSAAVNAGSTVDVHRYDGTIVQIVGATCLGPADVDPCQIEGAV